MARHVREVGTFVLSNSNLQVRLRKNNQEEEEMVILDSFGTCIKIIPENNCAPQNMVLKNELHRLNNGRIANWAQKSAEIAKLANSATKAKTKVKTKTMKANVKPKLKSVA